MEGDTRDRTIAEYPSEEDAYYARDRYLKLYPAEDNQRFIYISQAVDPIGFGEGDYNYG